jgi:hypothetical protein
MYNAIDRFLQTKCPMPGHWCNGKTIPKKGRRSLVGVELEDREPCEYYKPGKGCVHPENPRIQEKGLKHYLELINDKD